MAHLGDGISKWTPKASATLRNMFELLSNGLLLSSAVCPCLLQRLHKSAGIPCSLDLALLERALCLCDKKALGRYDERRPGPLESGGNPASRRAANKGGYMVARIESGGGLPIQGAARNAFEKGAHRLARSMTLCWAVNDQHIRFTSLKRAAFWDPQEPDVP